MMLPKKLGHLTLMRPLGSDGAVESYSAILDEPAGKAVVAHRLTLALQRDTSRTSVVAVRIQDLTAVRHPQLTPVLEYFDAKGEHFSIEEHIDGVDLATVIAYCQAEKIQLPPNLFLNIATQICNGLEALHGRPGKASAAENVLHLSLRPAAVRISPEGRLVLGGYDLGIPPDASNEGELDRIGALAPEQTQADPEVTPSTDIFALGSLLYELLTFQPLFRGETGLQTLHAVRKAEVSAALQQVKKRMPGLDKVLYRALSLNPRHRYQRAFVLREDIRGLMAGYSFNKVHDELISFLRPLFDARATQGSQGVLDDEHADTTATLLRHAALGGAAAEGAVGMLHDSSDKGSPVPPADVDGIEMWSEVPTAVDPTNPEASPELSPPPSRSRDQRPEDHTSWVRRPVAASPDAPPSDAFDHDETTDVTDANGKIPPRRSAPPTLPDFSSFAAQDKRQLSSEEAAELGIMRKPLPIAKDPTATNVPVDRRASPPRPQEQVLASDSRRAQAERDERARQERERAAKAQRAAEAAKQAKEAQRSNEAEQARQAELARQAEEARQAERAKASKSDRVDESFDDLDYSPGRSGRALVYAGVAVGVFLLLVLCGGGGIYAIYAVGQQVQLAAAELGSDEPSPMAEALDTQGEIKSEEDPNETIEKVEDPPSTDAVADAVAEPQPSSTRQDPSPAPPPPAPTRTPAVDPEPARTAAPRSTPSTDLSPQSPATTRTTTERSTSRSAPVSTASLAPQVSRDPDPSFSDDQEPESAISELDPEDRAAVTQRARQGALSSQDRLLLEMSDRSDPTYSEDRHLLLLDAKRRGDRSAQRTYVEALLDHPENKYNPYYLVEGALLDINDRNYAQALRRAEVAERHWARLPSDQIYERKAMIYEAQAASWHGMYNASGGEDSNALQRAISGWEKYQRHVQSKNDTERARFADEHLRKLYDAKLRME
ncbi:MAG: hypothetical protein EA397_11430 [Deltaproteobacteria bacterium]|nr:MAG: hypothetical protein EA397_11430 [Deltaproteobacteria bacterium]